jgi:hypothetical protein
MEDDVDGVLGHDSKSAFSLALVGIPLDVGGDITN